MCQRMGDEMVVRGTRTFWDTEQSGSVTSIYHYGLICAVFSSDRVAS